MWATGRALNVAVLTVLASTAFAFQQNACTFRLPVTQYRPSLSAQPLVKNIGRYKSNALLSSGALNDEEAKAPEPKPATLKNSLAAASMLIAFDIFCRRLFQAFSIGFPSALAGCGALFATFLLSPQGNQLYDILRPGSALLAKWLPLFFVPSLITLPLADSVGSIVEVSLICLLFWWWLLTRFS